MSELIWRRSSYSDSGGGDCVEVAAVRAGVRVRDSKRAAGAVVNVGAVAWRRFVEALD